MNSKYLYIFLITLLNFSLQAQPIWNTEHHKNYDIYFQNSDKEHIKEYNNFFSTGIDSVIKFFGSSYNHPFRIIIHPDRNSLDTTWQHDWKMPDFKSECWMVASGVADKLDIISPLHWDQLSCDHVYSEKIKTQQLITHELIHVYHGQKNASPDFSNTEGIDWFVEGLATYASGQCDPMRISEVKKAIAENKIPESLDNFWTGKIKYGLSGSVVMFIDHKYGRDKLKKLLPLTKKTEVLSALSITETELLSEWKKFMQDLK